MLLKKSVWLGLLLAAGLGAAVPKDLSLVRVITRMAQVFRAPDRAAARKGLAQFRDTFQLLDDEPVNGFWKVQFTDGPGYIVAADLKREAGPGDPSYRQAPGAAPTAAPAAALNPAQQDLLKLVPKPQDGGVQGPRPHEAKKAPAAEAPAAASSTAPARPGPAWAPVEQPTWLVYVPLAWGLGGTSQPALRPSASAPLQRPIEGAFGWGLGLEGRAGEWVDLYSEWTYNTHRTHAADRGLAALPVGLSSSAAVIFPNYGLDYAVRTHTFSFGTRVGRYFAPVRPWLGAGLTADLWQIAYEEEGGGPAHGSVSGQSFGFEASIGLDVYLKLFGSDGAAVLSPFASFFTPLVAPTVVDVGGTGLDGSGGGDTPLRAPVRLGVQLGLAF